MPPAEASAKCGGLFGPNNKIATVNGTIHSGSPNECLKVVTGFVQHHRGNGRQELRVAERAHAGHNHIARELARICYTAISCSSSGILIADPTITMGIPCRDGLTTKHKPIFVFREPAG
jgi:hypothetical protein